jgi:hypothetical protein
VSTVRQVGMSSRGKLTDTLPAEIRSGIQRGFACHAAVAEQGEVRQTAGREEQAAGFRV